MKLSERSVPGMLIVILVLLNAVILETALVKNHQWYKALWITIPALLLYLIEQWRSNAAFRRK
jgi:hypothetical protein